MTVEVPTVPAHVEGSPEAVRRLLLILLDNAVKYTPAGGSILIRASLDHPADAREGAVAIDVIDNGPGIDPADRPHVFERFYRGGSARHRVPAGSGLGLSIARAIVERHAGALTIDAGPDGRGCHVRVRLPTGPTSDHM